jgi:hypothetical protein
MRFRKAVGWAPLLLALFVGEGYGQEVDSIRARYLLRVPTATQRDPSAWMAPGVSLGVPSALGASYGDAFIAIGYQDRTRLFDKADGAAAFGFGVGNPRSEIGLELVVTSFGTVETCCRGGVSLKLHRFVRQNVAVAVGVENATTWKVNAPDGEAATDAGRSYYGVTSATFALRETPGPFSAVSVSAGIGGGRFRSLSAIREERASVQPFGSIGVRVLRQASVIADWTGHDLRMGASITPLARLPLAIAPAVADLTSKPRFVIGLGVGFDYSPIFSRLEGS